MFEVHDSIRDLPGTLPARKLLVDRAREYLDSLSQEASGDTDLQRELAAAYDRIGDLLGYSGAANLGDYAGALQSYEKALSIRESSLAAHPDDRQMQLDLLNDYFRLSFALQDTGDFAKALTHLQKGLALAQQTAKAHSEPMFVDFLAGFYWQTANVLMQMGDYTNALEKYRQGVSIRGTLVQNADTPVVRTHLAADYVGLGKAMSATGDLNGALEYSKKGAEILEQLSSSDPNNATLQEYLGEADDRVASILLKLHQLNPSLAYYNKSLNVFVKLSSADPANSMARDNVGLAEVAIGDVLIQQKQVRDAIPHVRNAIASFENIAHKNRYQVIGQASAYDAMGRALFSLTEGDLTVSQKSEHLQRSKVWFEKSLNTFRGEPSLNSVDPLGGDITEQSVRQELSKCEESLAKLQSR